MNDVLDLIEAERSQAFWLKCENSRNLTLRSSVRSMFDLLDPVLSTVNGNNAKFTPGFEWTTVKSMKRCPQL